MTDICIRAATLADLPALVEIFNHYVIHGHVTFDTELNTVASRTGWFAVYGDGPHQLLVAEADGAVQGCTYSSPYQRRPAFDATVETSIYLHPNRRRAGLGTRLYTDLLRRLSLQPVHLAVAGIALPNAASIGLHRKLGFEEIGTFKEYARKHGEWISSTWFQRPIEGTATPA